MPQDNPFPMLGGLTFSEDVFYRLLDDFLSTGIVGATDYQVIQNHLGANMSVDVQPGSAYVSFTSVAGGKRRTRLPAQSNSGTPGSPNSADKWLTTFVAADVTNPRIDRIVLTVRDTALDGSGASDSALRVIAGTPTAGATTTNLNGAAAVPANSILLANVLVPANATTIITANIANVATQTKLGAGNTLLNAPTPPPGFLMTPYKYGTTITVSGTVAETDILGGLPGVSIPGNTLGANGTIRVKLIVAWNQNTGGTWAPPILKVYLGATNVCSISQIGTMASLASPWIGVVEVEIQNKGATNSQINYIEQRLYVAGEQVDSAGDAHIGSSVNATAVDTTAAQTLRVTATPATAGGGYNYIAYAGHVEVF